MLSLEEIAKKLQGMNLVHVARESGINRNLLSKLRNGHVDNLYYSTVRALSAYLLSR
jgi:DNA-binding Xre family transcriptional regulator